MPIDVVNDLETACKALVVNDPELFDWDANERSFSHRLAVYLERIVLDKWGEPWHIDCEYNKNESGKEPNYAKTLKVPSRKSVELFEEYDPEADVNARTAYPDIIIHRRGTPMNLLVVEVKKGTSPPKEVAFDENHKLPAFIHELHYVFAASVTVSRKPARFEIKWFKVG